MSDAPERIWIQSDHIPDELALNEWDTRPDDNEVHLFTEYVRADRIKELEEKLAKALTALGDVQWFVKDLEPYADQGHTLVPALQKACAVYVELTSSEAAYGEAKGGKDE